MSVYFIIVYMSLEILSNHFDLISHFLDEEIRGLVSRTIIAVKFDNSRIIKVTDFFKTCLKYISLDIFVYFLKIFQFGQNLLTYLFYFKLIKMFTQYCFINSTKCHDK